MICGSGYHADGIMDAVWAPLVFLRPAGVGDSPVQGERTSVALFSDEMLQGCMVRASQRVVGLNRQS